MNEDIKVKGLKRANEKLVLLHLCMQKCLPLSHTLFLSLFLYIYIYIYIHIYILREREQTATAFPTICHIGCT